MAVLGWPHVDQLECSVVAAVLACAVAPVVASVAGKKNKTLKFFKALFFWPREKI